MVIRNGDHFYAIGGIHSIRMYGTRQTYKWNVLTGEWTQTALLRKGRYSHTLTAISENEIMVTGN